MTRYATHAGTRVTPQSQPIPGTAQPQVANSAGGFTWQVDCWTRLDRFLVLGAEGGSYYTSERDLTLEASAAVSECASQNPARTVARIVEISTSGRAPKNVPAIFALAQLCGITASTASAHALKAIPSVCRTGTDLFQFVASVESFRGWGRGLRSGIARWYTDKPIRDLAYQMVKYQQRDGWSHRDLLRLSHTAAAPGDLDRNSLFSWAVGKSSDVGTTQPLDDLSPVYAMLQAGKATTEREIVSLIREYRLVRECIPTQYLNSVDVWDALLDSMPLGAALRNLGKMSQVGLLKPLSAAVSRLCERFRNADQLRKARLHPLAILTALRTYASGHGLRGSLSWTAVPQIIDALNDAFYLAFKAVEPTGKRWLLALDVSGSMGSGQCSGAPITPREASAALSLVTANVEPNHAFVEFAAGSSPTMHRGYGAAIKPLAISAKQRLDDVIRSVSNIPFGGTDCALPMLYALENGLEVDMFVILTDSETWAGNTHPSQALTQYRQKTGINAKLIVCGMAANQFSIADPNDAGMLDVVGFDANCPALMAEFAKGF